MFLFMFVGRDLRLLLHLGFLTLLLRCCLLLRLSFLQDVGKQGSCKMFLILVLVFGYPHPLPLAWRYHTRLQLVCAINGGCTQYDIVLCLEHVHFLYAVHVHLVVLTAAEQVHLQVRLCLSHRIVFLCQFHSQTVHRVLRLFQCGEEAVQVCLVRIDGKRLLSFWLDIHRPTLVVILHHLYAIEAHLLALAYSIAYVYLGYVLQLPVLQSCHCDVLSCKIAVIRMVAQCTIGIVELDRQKTFLL